MTSVFPPPRERVATHCVCCGSRALNKSPAVLMPFIAHRVFGWTPVEITAEWGLQTLGTGHAYALCNSVQCDDCGHLFLDIRFDDQEMANLYQGYREEAYTALRDHYEPGYRARNEGLNAGVPYLDQIESFLAPYLPAAPRVLDWGGDTGENTPFKAHNELLHIYDISGKTGLVPGALQVGREAAFANGYDLVVCSNVLEHIPYPSDLLTDMRQAMGPETVLYVEIPQENIVRAPAPLARKRHWHEHINFYTESSIRTLLDRCGLAIADYQLLQATAGGNSGWLYQIACRRKADV